MSRPDQDARRPRGLTRRGLLLGTCAGLAAGGPLGWLLHREWEARFGERGEPAPFTGRSAEVVRPEYGMPGRFPGRVAEVRHEGSVSDSNEINAEAVEAMVDQGMCDLTGADHAEEAWASFFGRDDVVGIKVNPVGRARSARETGSRRDEVGSISSPAVLVAVVQGLKSAGVRPENIIVFERYADEFRATGYEELLRTRPMDGVRWLASSTAYTGTQVALDGHDNAGERDPHVVGYDPDVFVTLPYCSPDHDRRDDRRFRSHLSAIVTRMVNKIVTIPCLKDHRSAGVTLALKNMSHGMNNNVARSHISGYTQPDGTASHPNQCNTFIPQALGHESLRRKATLHILDGLIGVYEGGPGSWNPTWGTWRRKSLFFATDPVAMDHVGWDVIDARRTLEGWLPVARMGTLQGADLRTFSPRLLGLALSGDPLLARAALHEHQRRRSERSTEQFDRRQPEHVMLAGSFGLGTWDARQIDHRVRRIGGG